MARWHFFSSPAPLTAPVSFFLLYITSKIFTLDALLYRHPLHVKGYQCSYSPFLLYSVVGQYIGYFLLAPVCIKKESSPNYF